MNVGMGIRLFNIDPPLHVNDEVGLPDDYRLQFLLFGSLRQSSFIS